MCQWLASDSARIIIEVARTTAPFRFTSEGVETHATRRKRPRAQNRVVYLSRVQQELLSEAPWLMTTSLR